MEIKEKIIIFIIGLVGFFTFIINPIENIREIKNEIKINNSKYKGIISKNQIITKNILIEIDKKENIKEEENLKENGFLTLGEKNIYVNKFIRKHKLDLIQIGRAIKNKKEINVFYKLRGNEKNIIDFIIDLEKENKIFLLREPLKITMTEAGVELEGNLSSRIKDKYKEKIILGQEEKREEVFADDINFVNKNTAIINKNNKKYYINKSGEIEITGKKYKVEIKDNKLYLQEGE